MSSLPVLLIIWGVVVAAFIGVMVYRSNLTRHEVDELFITDSTLESVHEEHDEIVRRVNRIQPLVQGLGGLAALLTVAIIAVYVVNVLPDVKFQ
jgi:hypothetical protein